MKKIELRLAFHILLTFFIVGCSVPPEPKDEFLKESQRIYKIVSEQQGYPTENLLRCDWLPWYYHVGESCYLYPIPYFPYFFYNAAIVYAKEFVHLPISPVYGGTELQDNADRWAQKECLEYNKLFNSIWDQQNHANFVNMDSWVRNH